MKKAIIVGAVILAIGAGGWYVMNMSTTGSDSTGNAMPATETITVTETQAAMQPTGASGAMMEKTSGASGTEDGKDEAKAFTLDSFEFGYDKKTLTVKQGDTVTVTLTNSGNMMHDWIVDEFSGAKTKRITKGQTDTISFVADKKGTFEFYCSVGQHRANGMVGKLIVN